MIDGYVINNSGRGKYIFKRTVPAGSKVRLSDLYAMYKVKYGGEFDTGFLDWFEQNKLMDGFEIVIKSIEEDKAEEQGEGFDNENDDLRSAYVTKVHPSKLTARDISELKHKDNPKKIISGVNSIHKLRRALTMCKDRPGKELLIKFIRDRISDLQASGMHM